MKVYLVGGAVRDQMLNLPVKERDWVVVGATPQEMTDQGFRLVGKDFPVFLHPQSHEEYALARTERKTGPGYHGFQVHAAADVTLEQDLLRRDLTINAMAMDNEGQLVDPYHGQKDLEQRLLRHVSPAFSEDPVRILRVARFAARLAPLGFTVADDTLELMRGMVRAGEVDALVAERVWAEMAKALTEPGAVRFIEVLRDCGALAVLIPELDRLWGVPQPVEHHPEVDTGIHTLLVLEQACRLSPDPQVRLAALLHDLGKGITPPEQWPRHIDHESKGAPLVEAVCTRLRIPKDFRQLAVAVCKYHLHYHRAGELRPATILKTLQALDAFRRPQRFDQFLLACEADARGRPGYEERELPQGGILRKALVAAASVDNRPLVDQGLSGPQMAQALEQARCRAIAQALTLPSDT